MGDPERWVRVALHDEEAAMAEGPRLVDRLAEAATVRRAFGEPTVQDGTIVLPVARVTGGGGGGEGGRSGTNAEQGSGGGYGLRVTPSGVFVIRDGEVTWEPAFDLNRVVLGAQVVAVVALLTFRSVRRHRS
jgi:uncharacterized spore protein YtfJ